MRKPELADLLIVPFTFGMTMLIARLFSTDDAFGGKWFLVFMSGAIFIAYWHFARGRSFFWGGKITFVRWLLLSFIVLVLGLIRLVI